MLMVHVGQKLYTGGIDCFQKIVRNEGGVRALYRGLSANLVGIYRHSK
jgi:hypothetical protein